RDGRGRPEAVHQAGGAQQPPGLFLRHHGGEQLRLHPPLKPEATQHNSRRTAQAAYRAKIFRGIFQKCSSIHKGLPALFGSFRKKFSGALHHLELCGVALKSKRKKRFSMEFRYSNKVKQMKPSIIRELLKQMSDPQLI